MLSKFDRLNARLRKTAVSIISLGLLLVTFFSLTQLVQSAALIGITMPTQIGTKWSPFLEWELENSDYVGNPFDLIATATFW
ncbi:MAG: hypothetical protein GY943_04135 [Chloroflexi bacterium]|nr:hypothetical protein [Chloroflexota bacterium]